MRKLFTFISGFFLVYATSFISPAITHAADATVTIAGPNTASLGQTFTVRILIDSSKTINVMSGSLHYSHELLEVQKINYSQSIFKLWPQIPNNSPETSHITFIGGIYTPGFSAHNGPIIDVVFKARALGEAVVQIQKNSQILLNDGQGSQISWSATPYMVHIGKSEPPPPELEPMPPSGKDITPPSNLELYIGHDGQLFNGNWFAIFQAEDSGSGIDHYELAELENNQVYPQDTDWRKVNSPYQLLKQEQNTKIFLKAVDKSGNASVISREHRPRLSLLPTPDWRLLLILAVILILGIILPIFVFHRKKMQASVQE